MYSENYFVNIHLYMYEIIFPLLANITYELRVMTLTHSLHCRTLKYTWGIQLNLTTKNPHILEHFCGPINGNNQVITIRIVISTRNLLL